MSRLSYKVGVAGHVFTQKPAAAAIANCTVFTGLDVITVQHLSPVVVSATMIKSKCQSAMEVLPLWQMCTSCRAPM